jgi:hypothetical protein
MNSNKNIIKVEDNIYYVDFTRNKENDLEMFKSFQDDDVENVNGFNLVNRFDNLIQKVFPNIEINRDMSFKDISTFTMVLVVTIVWIISSIFLVFFN